MEHRTWQDPRGSGQSQGRAWSPAGAGRAAGRARWTSPLLALLVCLVAAAAPPSPPAGQEEEPAGDPRTLAGLPGWIVFDSRREGQFDIWKMRPDGTQAVRLTTDPTWETAPDWSPDGRRIVFARKDPEVDDEGNSIWIMDADGSRQRLLVRHGSAPQFAADGRSIIFERDRISLHRYNLETGHQQHLFESPRARNFPWQMIKPRLSPDGLAVAFISDKGGKWHSWTMDRRGRTREIGYGCQPFWRPDGRRIFYIAEGSYNETAIWSLDWPDGSRREHLRLQGTYRHVYFPSVSDDGRWLLFAACPANQHDHSSAHYQIFIAPLEGGVPIRLSRNDFTERWPRLSTAAR
jgi:Tol biopolymer transport system component